jgi:hypothetical protein
MVSVLGDWHMRGGILPPALLFSALGLALTFASRIDWAPSLLALIAGLGASSYLPLPQRWLEGAFFGCWISVIMTAASVHLRRGLHPRAAVALSLNAGFWGGAVASLSGSRADLLNALPCVLLLLPASWLATRHSSLPVKVASSWVIVVAALAAALQMLPVTPGYLPDHME